MTATRNEEHSWEKEIYWNLSNGWIAREAWNVHHGSFIRDLYSPDGKQWSASNGKNHERYNQVFNTNKYITLPSFAAAWVDKHDLVRLPSTVERIYP